MLDRNSYWGDLPHMLNSISALEQYIQAQENDLANARDRLAEYWKDVFQLYENNSDKKEEILSRIRHFQCKQEQVDKLIKIWSKGCAFGEE